MSHLPFNAFWGVALLAALAWTTAFSMLQPPIRGLRNLGLLASYGLGIAMAIQLPWREALFTWVAFAVAGGIAYVAYEAWSLHRQPASGERTSLAPLLHGFVAWPVMLPEAVEYALAELGVLKPPPAHEGAAPPSAPVTRPPE